MAARRGAARRSVVVRILKFGFPALAFALLAAVFLLSDRPVPSSHLTFSKEDLEAMKGGMEITAPRFSGQSLAGDTYDFQASSVTPRDLRLTEAEVEDLNGRIDYASGASIRIEAGNGRMDMNLQVIELDTGLRIRTSDGYDAQAGAARIDIAAATVDAAGPVEATGPIGRITAGRLRVEPPAGTAEPSLGKETVLHFRDGVTLRYTPVQAD